MKTISKIACAMAFLAFAASAFLPGCSMTGEEKTPIVGVMDQAEQTAMTPDQALVRLVAGNRRFMKGDSTNYNYIAQAKVAANGQHPFAVVLSCLDSRSTPEIVFDQGVGDLFVARVAGNFENADILGSMEFATKVVGSKLVVVMGHTECGAIKGACDNVELGNLTSVITALKPAVAEVKEPATDRNSKNKKFVQAVAEANVRRTVTEIRRNSEILREMEKSGQIKIVGAMHDLATGEVTFYDWKP